MVLYFPDHSLLSRFQDQHGHSVPSTRAIAPLVASAADSAVGLSSSVAFSINGVRNVMYPRYCRLGDTENVGPYVLDYVLPEISASDDYRLPQGQLARAPFAFIPRLFE